MTHRLIKSTWHLRIKQERFPKTFALLKNLKYPNLKYIFSESYVSLCCDKTPPPLLQPSRCELARIKKLALWVFFFFAIHCLFLFWFLVWIEILLADLICFDFTIWEKNCRLIEDTRGYCLDFRLEGREMAFGFCSETDHEDDIEKSLDLVFFLIFFRLKT